MLDKETYSIEVFYDPALGRFLSPDPVVQAPDDTQSFNRYSMQKYGPNSKTFSLYQPLGFVSEQTIQFAHLLDQ
ncbi:MAG: hypothetical protein J5565_02605 [Muribaculaceae bacterium]|nr:hypothetical protein [Muribaculaceae bacterium]